MYNLRIVPFHKRYSSTFYHLNKIWIEESWLLEESDKFDLLNPEESINFVTSFIYDDIEIDDIKIEFYNDVDE